MDVADPRFGRLYTDAAFHIDPSASDFKKTLGMESLVEERLKRRKVDIDAEDQRRTSTKAVEDSSQALTSLVSSIKAKTNRIQKKRRNPLIKYKRK